MMRLPLRWSLFGLFAILAGCGERGDLYVHRLAPLPLLAASDALVQVTPQTNYAVLVRPDNVAPKAIRISRGARKAAVSPSGEVVAILGGAFSGGMIKRPVLDLLVVKDGSVLTLDTPGVFDEIAFSPDGQTAILSYAAGTQTVGLAARNLNEIALVNLAPPSVTRMQLDTDSLAPRGVVFAGTTGRAAILLDHGVAVLDTRNPQRAPRRISIRPQGSGADTNVLEALFSENGRFLFIRASGIDDVIVVELGSDAQGQLTASVNFVAGGALLSDIDVPLPPAPADTVLAVYKGTKEAVLLDARGIEDNAVRLALPAALGRIHALPGGRALVFDGTSRTVLAWDVNSRQSGTAVLEATFDLGFFTATLGKAIFRHPNVGPKGTSGSALSVVSVEDAGNRLRARIQSIQLSTPAAAPTFDAYKQRFFFAGTTEALLVGLDVSTLQLAQVKLDARAEAVYVLPARDMLAVVHPGNEYGDVTFVPASTLERSAAIRVTDFALTTDLDRPREE